MRRGCEGAAHWPFPHIACSGMPTAQVGSVEMVCIYLFIDYIFCKKMMFYVSASKLYQWNQLSQCLQLSDLWLSDVLPLSLWGTGTDVQRGLQLQPLGGDPVMPWLQAIFLAGVMRDPVLGASCPRILDVCSNCVCWRANKCP